MSFNQFLKGLMNFICYLFWIFLFIGTLIWVGVAEGLVNKVFIMCLSALVYYVTIVYRENKWVLGFMLACVIFVIIFIYAASRTTKKH